MDMESFFPNREQMDVHNSLLASIASNMTDGHIGVRSWEDVQRIVRMGLAPKMFIPGDEFQAEFQNTPKNLAVIGINHDVPTDKNFTNSMTIQFKDHIVSKVFCPKQAFYNVGDGLVAGTHIFTFNNLQYTFDSTVDIPEGGVIVVATWDGDTYIPATVTSYQADRATVIEASMAITPTSGLVDTLTPTNYYSRAKYGSNNWVESPLRLWLNSEGQNWWSPQTDYDMRPSYYNEDGFLSQLDPELLAVIGSVDKQVARNTVSDGGGQDFPKDKIFLLSQVEVNLGTSYAGDVTGEAVYPYWKDSTDADRMKGGTWWLRSPYASIAHNVRTVDPSGAVRSYYARYSNGLVPACVII